MQISPYLYLLDQSSWKSCVYLDLDFSAVLPEDHFLHSVHVLHLLMGRKQSQEFCMPSEILCNVKLREVNIITGVICSVFHALISYVKF
jgi:hypothetical protein